LQLWQREGGDSGDAVAAGCQLPELAEPLDIVVGIKTLSALGPMRSDYSIAPLPGPEDVGRQAGATRHQANGMSWRIVAAVLVHPMII
jgi:hypothetical protein